MTVDLDEGAARLAHIAATKEDLALKRDEDSDVLHEEALCDWENWLAFNGPALIAELREARRDAERYRWLRDPSNEDATTALKVELNEAEWGWESMAGEELDAAIDAARLAGRQEK